MRNTLIDQLAPVCEHPDLRDYFAGQALVGFLRYNDAFEHPEKAAEWAYEQADMMLQVRARTQEDEDGRE